MTTDKLKAAIEWAEDKIQSEILHLKEATPSFKSHHQDNIAHLRTLAECARKVEELEMRNAELVKEIGKPTDLPHGNGSLYARINFWKDAADMAEDRAAQR